MRTDRPSLSAALLDQFMPRPDVRERHETIVRAPAELVFGLACKFNLQSLLLVRAIIWLRAKLLRAKKPRGDSPKGLVAETLAMGWGVLAEEPNHLFVAGAACRPWHADVTFTPIAPDQFATYAAPDQVKIAWTIEAEPLALNLTRFSTETRVVATDDRARVHFRRYWRLFGIGIVAIRRLLLAALRREAEGSRCTIASRAVAVWLVLIGVEIIHGTLRNVLIAPYIGDFRARQLSVFTASLLILWIAYLFIGWIHAASTQVLISVGFGWLALTVAFELGIGRLVLGRSWDSLTSDYKVWQGGLLPFGLVVLTLSPYIASKLRGHAVTARHSSAH